MEMMKSKVCLSSSPKEDLKALVRIRSQGKSLLNLSDVNLQKMLRLVRQVFKMPSHYSHLLSVQGSND